MIDDKQKSPEASLSFTISIDYFAPNAATVM